ncbi:MAG: hypothetical protein DRI37_09145 [Chloroflexi bacterium]|nr:MAG: hypothetical protein DRI37_09145 [Chloroflexota bacterium]
MKLFNLLLFFLLIINIAYAQKSEPNTINAFKTKEKIKFDGKLNEAVWQQVPHISNFTQRDLNFGKPITERTEVAVIYNKNTLYFGVWCYQSDASTIVAKNMNRDFAFESDDNFQIIISPFDDNRNGYLFVINPNGARSDVQVYGGEDGNEDWNGVWDAKTTRTDKGWFAEIYIPFNTMQFKKDSVLNWAINFERDIVSKNEQALWQGWSRDNSIYSVNKAGKLLGITDIAYVKKFELKPYFLAGWQFDKTEGSTYPIKFGGDLNVSISPTLKLNISSYTDFAQVENDRIPVNLSRFSIFYPEKRQFFLDGYDMYSFYLGDMNRAFYTREIGVKKGQQVPIVAGARLFGKEGKHNIGFLNIQEARLDSIPTTNNTVFRYKYDIGEQSYVGGIFTNKINSLESNQVIGLDGAYQTSKFLKNKNLVIKANVATSLHDFKSQNNALTYRFFIDYPNDLIDNFVAVGSMQKDFNPELGYIHRTNYNSYAWHFRIMPRVLKKYGVKRLLLKPWGFNLYNTQTTRKMESFNNEIRPIGAIFKSGERFEFNLIQNYDRIDEPFVLTDNLDIPIGKYWMYKYEFQFETYNARRIWTEFLYNWGDFYTGKIKTFEATLGININKHTNVNVDYTLNQVDLPNGLLTTSEIALYLNYAFTTKLNFSMFGQYNDLEQITLCNFRLHWIPKVGSDLYVVYNIGYSEPIKQIDYLKPQTTDAVVKLVYRFVF